MPLLADSPTCNTAYNALSCVAVAAGADASPASKTNTNAQIVGAHCPEVVINNSVEELGGLNGLYRWYGTFSNARPVYRQVDGLQ